MAFFPQSSSALPSSPFGILPMGRDNLSTFSMQFGQYPSTPGSVLKDPGYGGNPYANIQPTAETTLQEDSSTEPTTYAVKISPTDDNSHMNLTQGDLLYSYGTRHDMTLGHEIHTFYSLAQMNKRAVDKAKILTEDGMMGLNTGKRGKTGSNTFYDRAKSVKIFPSRADDFWNGDWRRAGVMSWSKMNLVPDMSYKQGFNVNRDYKIFRLASIATWSKVVIPTLVCEDVKLGRRLYEIGSVVDQTFESTYDSRGRKLTSGLKIPAFQVRLTCNPDNSHPSLLQNCAEIETYREIVFPQVNPVNSRRLPADIPVIQMRTTEIEEPYIRVLGEITEVDGPIPMPSEIARALVDEKGYNDVKKSSRLSLNLYAKGWGPYHDHC